MTTPTVHPVHPDNPVCRLEIRALRSRVHLGVSTEERSFPQEVEFQIRIAFKTELVATQTDALDDTLCYGTLCDHIDRTVRARSFHLIEALARTVYEEVARTIQGLRQKPQALIEVTVHKLHPPVENLRGGAVFVYGDRLD